MFFSHLICNGLRLVIFLLVLFIYLFCLPPIRKFVPLFVLRHEVNIRKRTTPTWGKRDAFFNDFLETAIFRVAQMPRGFVYINIKCKSVSEINGNKFWCGARSWAERTRDRDGLFLFNVFINYSFTIPI